jgi:hypothetical protein
MLADWSANTGYCSMRVRSFHDGRRFACYVGYTPCTNADVMGVWPYTSATRPVHRLHRCCMARESWPPPGRQPLPVMFLRRESWPPPGRHKAQPLPVMFLRRESWPVRFPYWHARFSFCDALQEFCEKCYIPYTNADMMGVLILHRGDTASASGDTACMNAEMIGF